ncbi:O-Glycosyl hydrolase family 30 protein [Aphelenchoides avenae]|nr:O-Glycosyl hydrolase family 30 protein [Aphelenchus avenae]
MGTRAYSYCDKEGDFKLETFNLTQEDFDLKIPFIQTAYNLSNGDLKLFASPWSAPGWMKETGKMVGGGSLKGDVDGEYYRTWANYFLRFFEEYHKQGISFWGVTMQNEPSSGASLDYGWQTMYFTPAMQRFEAFYSLVHIASLRDFLKNLLGPTLKGSPLTRNLKIMVNDDQRYMLPDTADEILDDKTAASFVDGIAVHWYEDFLFSAQILSTTHEHHPTKFILPSEGGPTFVGNYLDASIIVNNTADEFYKQPQYYALGHFSKLITPGSQRVDLQISGYSKDLLLDGVAFRTAYAQFVVVLSNRNPVTDYQLSLVNPSNSRQSVDIDVNRNSIVSIIWNAY